MPTTKHWSTEVDAEINLKVSHVLNVFARKKFSNLLSLFFFNQTTLYGPASVPPTTVCEVLKRVVKQYPSKPALRVKRDGEWITWTWRGYYQDIAAAAKSMIRVGVEPFRGVCTLGFNAPEWFIAYMGGIMVRLLKFVCLFFVRLFVGWRSGVWYLHH